MAERQNNFYIVLERNKG